MSSIYYHCCAVLLFIQGENSGNVNGEIRLKVWPRIFPVDEIGDQVSQIRTIMILIHALRRGGHSQFHLTNKMYFFFLSQDIFCIATRTESHFLYLCMFLSCEKHHSLHVWNAQMLTSQTNNLIFLLFLFRSRTSFALRREQRATTFVLSQSLTDSDGSTRSI
jgi:hypothetical protein